MNRAPTLFVIAVLCCTADTHASTLLWDESVDGSSAGRPLLSLQAGTNEILGSSRWAGDEDDSFLFTERDWYELELAQGLQITAISILVSNQVFDTTNGTLGTAIDWTLQQSDNTFVWEEISLLATGEVFSSFSALPLQGGDTFLLNQASSLSSVGSWDITWDYRVLIEVTPVPLPAAILMMIPALGLLAVFRQTAA